MKNSSRKLSGTARVNEVSDNITDMHYNPAP